jgi:adenylate cyclase
MDRIWQWAWDRCGARYTWAIWAIMFAPMLLTYVAASFLVVAFEKSHHYVEATIVAGAAVVVFSYVLILPDGRGLRLAQRWARGEEVDLGGALKDTYFWRSSG